VRDGHQREGIPAENRQTVTAPEQIKCIFASKIISNITVMEKTETRTTKILRRFCGVLCAAVLASFTLLAACERPEYVDCDCGYYPDIDFGRNSVVVWSGKGYGENYRFL
jgi:hypothetical protein